MSFHSTSPRRHPLSLELDGVQLNWPDFTLDASLSVAPGETLVLAGPSGCGKTSLLRAAAGFLPLDRGAIRLAGREIGALPPWERGIGYVFQEANLFPHLSVAGNVAYGPFVRGIPRRERRERVEKALELVHMERFRSRRPDTLSGGERQRIAIARALANDPAALFLDEPFSSLDAPLRRDMQEAFCELKSRLDIPAIFVTHDREEAAAVADRIAIMEAGRIVEVGRSGDIFTQPRRAFTARFLALGTILSRANLPEPLVEKLFKTDSLRRGNSSAWLLPVSAVAFARDEDGVTEEGTTTGDAVMRVRGRVIRRRFEGASWLYEVDAGLGEAIMVRAASILAANMQAPSMGAPSMGARSSQETGKMASTGPLPGEEVTLAIDCRGIIGLEGAADSK